MCSSILGCISKSDIGVLAQPVQRVCDLLETSGCELCFLLRSCEMASESPHLSEPQLEIHQMRIVFPLCKLSQGLKEMIYIKCHLQRLVLMRGSKSISYLSSCSLSVLQSFFAGRLRKLGTDRGFWRLSRASLKLPLTIICPLRTFATAKTCGSDLPLMGRGHLC